MGRKTWGLKFLYSSPSTCSGAWLKVYLSILSPGPARAKPTHEPYWAGMGRDLEAREFFLVRAWLEMLFLIVLHYKMRG
jgi:hypothetical protein